MVFTAALVRITSGGIYRHFSRVMISAAVFTAAIDLAIRDTLVRHLEDNGLLHDTQHGFRKGRSWLTNLLTFMYRVTGCLDSGNPADAIFLDFAKDFDKVPHERLALKLEAHGFTGKLLQWIVVWLKERKQRICINGTKPM